jgi:RNA recognition motif-containing protein
MKNIYVGNLAYDATEDQVRGIFEQYGPVDRVSIITDRDTGQPRGFAFVEMSDDDSAGKAMEALNGTNLGGRNLTVNEARPKADRPRRDGGGGGRGGFNRGGGGGRGGRGGGGWDRY